ncbi:hypothetical protein [Celeribacter sp. PS-C1]|uniref:hypothetical protein n=1 Tax=Celeribacter sp. PS-C1 TaxID=2820813 RepID=UPI001CA59F76|nr:hypothetical protein [Celeribacter sp. PS-C1]MBW6419638.1 hypothetical protein [Celeribacter sp. PS-C1]
MTTVVNITDHDIKLGKKVLKQALKEAQTRLLAQDHALPLEIAPLPTILTPFICISNLRSLVIHEGDGGWYADFVLKYVPEGWPDTVGTLSGMPHPSESDARRMGFERVNHMYQREQAGLAPKEPFRGTPLIIGNQVIFVSYEGL